MIIPKSLQGKMRNTFHSANKDKAAIIPTNLGARAGQEWID